MKRSESMPVFLLALAVVTGLSILYWRDVGEKIVTAHTMVDGREVPIRSVETGERKIALSFEWSEDAETLSRVLAILQNMEVQATFFVSGEWVEQYPREAVQIVQEGHELGNGGDTHQNMTDLSAGECRKEVMRLHEKVKDLTGYEMKTFRPPYGSYNDAVLRTVYACGYYPVCWSIDTMDWKNYGAQDLADRVAKSAYLKNGAIVTCKGRGKYLEPGLEEMIEAVQEQGYEIGAVSDLIYREKYYMEGNGRQHPQEE